MTTAARLPPGRSQAAAGIAPDAARAPAASSRLAGGRQGQRRMTRLGTLLPLLLLGACAQWPPEGTGGLAEMRPDLPVAAEAPLVQRLACALERISVLETAAASAGQGTGQVAMLRVMATRATRETHGNLSRDANLTLDRLGSGAALLQPVVGLAALPECT